MPEAESRRRRRKKRGNTCKNQFSQELCVDFNVVFAVDIEDVEIEDVTCPGGGS